MAKLADPILDISIMLKDRLIGVILVAVASVCFMCYSEAINVSQMDALKNQFLPAEYRNTNFSLGKLRSFEIHLVRIS